MVFIGQNNHGKSNLLTALLFFFGESSCQELDFRNGTDQLSVEITFDDLDELDLRTFQKYVNAKQEITVRRSAEKNTTKCEYRGYVEEPIDDWLIESNANRYAKREDAEKTPLKDILPESGRITKAIFVAAQVKYIENNRDSLNFQRSLESTPFLGAKSVASGIWGEVYFIPAVKKASDEVSVKGTTAFSKLYQRVLNAMSESSEEFLRAKTEMATLVKRLNKLDHTGAMNEDRPSELTEFEALLDSELSDWDTKVDVEIILPDVDGILKIGTNVWIDDGIRTDIQRKGQGLQRALIFALIRALAKLSESDRRNEDVARKASRSTYFIFEEPELFLHPQAQRSLFASLQELSKSAQVCLCTHSSAFLNLEWYKSICRVEKKDSKSPTTITQCTVDIFAGDNAKKQFNLSYWINPDRSEIFFAKKVILVEGPTDKTILPKLAQDLDIYRHEVTLVDCGSKDNIPQYINLLNYFGLPYVAVYDKDKQILKTAQAKQTADRSSELIESKISTHLGTSVIFENDIEEELGMT